MTIPAGFKPNLAATLTKPALLKFPVWASPKIDGVRCVVFGGVAYSRTLKPIPNPHVQDGAKYYERELEGLDGELVVGSATDPNCMQNTTSGVMKRSGEPEFTFHAFDYVYPGMPYGDRMRVVRGRVAEAVEEFAPVKLVPQHYVMNAADLAVMEEYYLDQGYEGLMIRSGDAPYKYGRSTEREGGLVKVKRFVDAEAVVVGFEEEMRNENEATRDATGRTERSTAQAGLVGKGTLGALVVRDEQGRVFNIGTGFTAAQRADIWRDSSRCKGLTVKYKHFDHGTVDAPRHPVFLGFRAPEDMSE